jgi:DNA-binding winged helix-turn-helix (wHTH) protein
MQPHIRPKPFRRRYPLRQGGNASHRASAGEVLEFRRFRVLLRQRQLLADGVSVELGTRTFDLLLVLLEADGSLVTKEELMSRVWPDIVVSEENLKFQVSVLRKALGADRDVIHTEFGRGYRFTGVLRSDAAGDPGGRPMRSSARSGCFFTQSCRQSLWSVSVRQEVSDFSSQAPRAVHAPAMRPHFPSLSSPSAKIGQAPLPEFTDAAGRREPSATDRSALSCKGEET